MSLSKAWSWFAAAHRLCQCLLSCPLAISSEVGEGIPRMGIAAGSCAKKVLHFGRCGGAKISNYSTPGAPFDTGVFAIGCVENTSSVSALNTACVCGARQRQQEQAVLYLSWPFGSTGERDSIFRVPRHTRLLKRQVECACISHKHGRFSSIQPCPFLGDFEQELRVGVYCC